MKILWLESLDYEQIALNTNLFKELLRPRNIIINIGFLKIKLNVMLNEDMLENTIGLPKNLSQMYTIPTEIPYECFVKNREIHIGPVIAYVDLDYFKNVQDRIYFSILPKFMDYYSISGLIFICTPDSINIDSNVIKGYYFDPRGQTPEKAWKYGRFPLPNAFFNRSFLSQEKISKIQNKIGDTIFNSYWYNLNKWEMWENLSGDIRLKKHLPYTEKYLGVKQLIMFLKKYKSAYLKPYNKSRGKGIMKVIKARKSILVIDNSMQKWRFKNDRSLSKFLKKRIKRRRPYIVQQAVPFKINKQLIDFRIILQKDESKKWVYSGLMARVAPPGGIITNLRGNPKTMLGRDVLIDLYKFNQETVEKIEREMTDLVIRAIEKYEQKGMHLGDVAADIVLDDNLHMWLLELQLNHAMYGNTKKLPAEFFIRVLTNPFKYAKALAGFYSEEGE